MDFERVANCRLFCGFRYDVLELLELLELIGVLSSDSPPFSPWALMDKLWRAPVNCRRAEP